MNRLSIVSELWQLMRVRKKWWLLPIFFIVALLGLLTIFSQTSIIAPFIYPLI